MVVKSCFTVAATLISVPFLIGFLNVIRSDAVTRFTDSFLLEHILDHLALSA